MILDFGFRILDWSGETPLQPEFPSKDLRLVRILVAIPRLFELPVMCSLCSLDEAKANLLDALTQVMEYHREQARKSGVPGAVREELQLAVS